MSKTILLDQLPTHIENLYQINGICSARSPCLATVCYIKRLLIKSIWYYTQLTRFVVQGLWVLLAMLTLSENFESS